jgi:DNA polymerase-3 subunit delta
MVAIKSQDADRYLSSPPDGIRLFLIYGSDAGAVTERARHVEQVALARGGADAVSRFGSDQIADDPGRLADEARSASLFGGEPVIALRILDGRHNVLGALQDVLARPPDSAWLVVEAGDLGSSSPLRRAFETSPRAAAVPTYPAEGAGLISMIRVAAEAEGVLVESHALELLASILGGDRLASRRELEKLFLYVGGGGPVTAADVAAVVGETAEVRTEAIIDAALLGEHEALESGLERLPAEGGSAAALGAQMLRHLIQLAGLRATVDAGTSISGAVEGARPPIFFKRRSAVGEQLKRWRYPDLAEARRRIAESVALTRRLPGLENAAISEALHAIALDARRLRCRPR